MCKVLSKIERLWMGVQETSRQLDDGLVETDGGRRANTWKKIHQGKYYKYIEIYPPDRDGLSRNTVFDTYLIPTRSVQVALLCGQGIYADQ